MLKQQNLNVLSQAQWGEKRLMQEKVVQCVQVDFTNLMRNKWLKSEIYNYENPVVQDTAAYNRNIAYYSIVTSTCDHLVYVDSHSVAPL